MPPTDRLAVRRAFPGRTRRVLPSGLRPKGKCVRHLIGGWDQLRISAGT